MSRADFGLGAGRQRPRLEPVKPDPRSQTVLFIEPAGWGSSYYVLTCGHTLRRRLHVKPDRLICTACPPCGGVGRHTVR